MAKTPAIKKHIVQAIVPSTMTSEGQDGAEDQFSDDNIEMNTEMSGEEEEIVSDVEQEGVFDFKSSKLSHDRNDAVDPVSAPSLFDTFINAKGVAVKIMIEEWKQEWMADERDASLQLVNLILRSSNVPPADRWEEEDPAAVISALQDHITDPSRAYALSQKRFRSVFEDFWMKWAMDVMPGLVDGEVIEHGLMSWIVCMSSSVFRPLRMTATTAALKILSGCAKSLVQISKQKKKQASKGDGIAYLERIIQVLFDSVFVQRYRDIDTTIRERCLIELVVWMEARPETFLDNTYLRYLGWSLSDKQARVRKASAAGIKQLLKPVSWRKSLKPFIDRFAPRLVEMASKDVDEGVRHSSMGTVVMLHECRMLSSQDRDFVLDLVRRRDWQTLGIASKLFIEELSSRVTVEAPFRAGMMIIELIHMVEQLVPKKDVVDALEQIIEVTGDDLASSLGNFLDIIALVNARLASCTERSGARRIVGRVYGKECSEQVAVKLVNAPVEHHLVLCCYRLLVKVTHHTEHVASIAASVGRVMKAVQGCDEAVRMLHLIPESEALCILEELIITCHDACTPKLATELWSGMEAKELVIASQERILKRMIGALAFDRKAKSNDTNLSPSLILAELTKQIKGPRDLSDTLIKVIDDLSTHLQLTRESEYVLECWSALLQCFFQDILWRLKDACREGDPEFLLLDKRDRLIRWCDVARFIQEYADDPSGGNWSRALSAASILVDLACLSVNSIPMIHGWSIDIDCRAVFDLLGVSGGCGTEEEHIKLITMACKTVIRLGQDTGIRHVLRAYRPSADLLIRTAFNHVKDGVNVMDCVMSAIEDNTNIEALMGILRVTTLAPLPDTFPIAKSMLRNAVLAEDDQIIAKCINGPLLSKLSDEGRRALLDFIEEDSNLGDFKGGPALANLIKQLGRKKTVRRVKTTSDAISSVTDIHGIEHPTSEQQRIGEEYNVLMDHHTQQPIPPTLQDITHRHLLSDPFVQAEMQTFVGASPFVQEDAANPFADGNPFYTTKYSDGRTSQVESEEGRYGTNDDAGDSENRTGNENKRTFRSRTRINYAEPDDEYVGKKALRKEMDVESPAKKPKRQHIRL